MPLPDMRQQGFVRQPARILGMAAINDIGERRNGSTILQPDRAQDLAINAVHLLALGEICMCFSHIRRRDAESNAMA